MVWSGIGHLSGKYSTVLGNYRTVRENIELWCARIRISQRDIADSRLAHSGNLGGNALVGATPSAASVFEAGGRGEDRGDVSF